MSLFPLSFGGGSGFVSRCMPCTPVQTPVQNTCLQTMKVFKLLIKIFFLATVILTAMAASLTKPTPFESIAFRFCRHGVHKYQWLAPLLNTIYAAKMSDTKYQALFTNNTKTELKADAVNQIDKWIIGEVQLKCVHAASANETRTMKDLMKKENSPLIALYSTGDFERVDDSSDLADFFLSLLQPWKSTWLN